MNQLQTFENELFKVSAKTNDGEVLFDVEQVARSLGFTTVAKSGNVTIRWARVNSYLPNNSPQVAKGDFISEPLVYKLAFKAQNEVAEKFQDWLAIEVIPSIRKHGAYATPDTIENIISDPDFGIQLLTTLKEEKDLRKQEELRRIEAEETIKSQIPKVVFAESCLASQDSVLVKDVAKLANNQGVKIGQNRLFNKLRDWNYIQKNNTQPTQRAIESGYFEVLQRNIQTPEGTKLTRTTKVTTKGQLRILNRLKQESEQVIVQ